jgi:hypothetical protein
MYFTIIEVIPEKESSAYSKYAGAHIACWINLAKSKEANQKAIELIVRSGWSIVKVIEEKEVFADSYSLEDDGLEYFEQALIDGEVCVVHTFPKRVIKRKRRLS